MSERMRGESRATVPTDAGANARMTIAWLAAAPEPRRVGRLQFDFKEDWLSGIALNRENGASQLVPVFLPSPL